jgi:hypothetical protein
MLVASKVVSQLQKAPELYIKNSKPAEGGSLDEEEEIISVNMRKTERIFDPIEKSYWDLESDCHLLYTFFTCASPAFEDMKTLTRIQHSVNALLPQIRQIILFVVTKTAWEAMIDRDGFADKFKRKTLFYQAVPDVFSINLDCHAS